MRSFNNWIKSNIIYTYINAQYADNNKQKVLDIGCGRGGDIDKFYYCEIEMLVGIDPSLDGLTNAADGAITRYQQIKSKSNKADFPPMFWINANPANILQYDEQVRIIGRMNQDNKKLIERFFSFDDKRTMFDRFNCSFAIHYLLSDDNSWNNFCENINMYLRDGGYFIFETFDGDRIKEKLKGTEKIAEYYEENGEKKLLYEIVKKYDDNTKEKIGLAIDVHMAWISEEGVFQTEYLVFSDFIIKSLKEKCNMELVETGLFENLFNDNRQFLELGAQIDVTQSKKFFGNSYNFYEPTELNKKCQSYTFLNRFYVFRKIEPNLAEVKEKYYTNRKKVTTGNINLNNNNNNKFNNNKFNNTNNTGKYTKYNKK